MQGEANAEPTGWICHGDEASVGEEEAPIIRYVHMVEEALSGALPDGLRGGEPKRLQPSCHAETNVSIAEKRVPQDGRINIKVGAKVMTCACRRHSASCVF